MATRQRGWPAKNVSTCSRLSFLRNTTAPDTLAPCAWNTCLARSRPIVLTSSTDASLRWSSNTTTLARRCCRGASTPSLEDDDVPHRLAPRPGRGAMAPRRANQRRDVPPLRRRGPRPDPAARRHRRHGQSRLAQEQSRAARHQGDRRPPPLPAQILARPEPHRAALLEAQALAPKSRRPNHRRSLQRSRTYPRDRNPRRMLKLLRSRPARVASATAAANHMKGRLAPAAATNWCADPAAALRSRPWTWAPIVGSKVLIGFMSLLS